TSNSVPHEPQWTLAWKYLGWVSLFTSAPSTPSERVWPAGGRRCDPGPLRLGGGRLGRNRDDPDALLVAGRVLEAHLPVDRREDGVVVAQARALARGEGHAALADDDRPGRDELAVAGLDAEPLARAVAAILDARARLLVRHRYSSFFVRGRLGAASVRASSDVALALAEQAVGAVSDFAVSAFAVSALSAFGLAAFVAFAGAAFADADFVSAFAAAGLAAVALGAAWAFDCVAFFASAFSAPTASCAASAASSAA